jgi:hypothetical protein
MLQSERASREPWRAMAEMQDGVISRSQLLNLGLTPARARRDVDSGRWQPLLPGVHLTHTGTVDPIARVWAALLYAGTGAAAGRRTALWLAGMFDEATDPVHVSIPASRRVLRQPGIRIRLSRALDDASRAILHPSAAPPRVRLEVALLDHCESETATEVTHLVLSAIQRRLTTANRIRTVIDARPRHRWRRLIIEMLIEAAAGVASPLELHYRRAVERRHGLPDGTRNRAERAPDGGRCYRDVRYPRWRLIVELDGREAHPAHRAFRDLRRDNWAAVGGDTALRYGWRDALGDPCAVAAQVAHVLAGQGWTGRAKPCGPACVAGIRPL